MTADAAETLQNGTADNAAFSLATILDEDNEHLEHPDFKDKPEGGWDEEAQETEAVHGYCIECEGTQCDRLPASCLEFE